MQDAIRSILEEDSYVEMIRADLREVEEVLSSKKRKVVSVVENAHVMKHQYIQERGTHLCFKDKVSSVSDQNGIIMSSSLVLENIKDTFIHINEKHSMQSIIRSVEIEHINDASHAAVCLNNCRSMTMEPLVAYKMPKTLGFQSKNILRVNSSSDISICSCVFSGMGGIKLNDSSDVVIHGCSFEDCGIMMEGQCKDVVISKCVFQCTDSTSFTMLNRSMICIQSTSESNIAIRDCIIHCKYTSIHAFGSSINLRISDTTIKEGHLLIEKGVDFGFSKCVFQGMEDGIHVKDRAEGTFKECFMDQSPVIISDCSLDDSVKVVNTIIFDTCTFVMDGPRSVILVKQECTVIQFLGKETEIKVNNNNADAIIQFMQLRNVLIMDTEQFVCTCSSSSIRLFNDQISTIRYCKSMYCCFRENMEISMCYNGKTICIPINTLIDSLQNTYIIKPSHIGSLVRGIKLIHAMQFHPHIMLKSNSDIIIPYQITIRRNFCISCSKGTSSPIINISPTCFISMEADHPVHITMNNLQIYNISSMSAHRYFLKFPSHSFENPCVVQSKHSVVCDSCHFTTDLGRCTENTGFVIASGTKHASFLSCIFETTIPSEVLMQKETLLKICNGPGIRACDAADGTFFENCEGQM